jgi:DNA polymerase elongation subunit (family B)
MFRLFDFNIVARLPFTDEDSSSDSDDYEESSFKREPEQFIIQMFGVNEKGETCGVFVSDYRPFFYVLVKDDWTIARKNDFMMHIKTKIGKYHSKGILDAKLIKRKRLYGFDNRKEYKFVCILFDNMRTFNKVKDLWYYFDSDKNKRLSKYGYNKYDGVNTYIYESNIPPILRFFHINNISPSGWVKINSEPLLYDKSTTCTYEYIVNCSDITPLPDKETRVPYKICSFDIEADSSHGDFPIPVKSYKKLANNIVEYFEQHPEHRNKRECGGILIRLITFAFQYGADTFPEISMVYPINHPTKSTLDRQIASFMIGEIDKDDILGNTNNGAEICTIETMFINAHRALQETNADEDTTDPDELIEDDSSIDLECVMGTSDLNTDYTISDEVSVRSNSESIPVIKPPGHTISSIICDKRYKRETLVEKLNVHLCRYFNKLQGDRVTFIGSSFMTYGQSTPYLNHCICLNSCDSVANAEIESYETERDVLVAWSNLIQRENPDIIVGYNIFGFDYEFMFRRAEVNECAEEFLKLSRNIDDVCGIPVPEYPGKYRIEKTTMKQFEINYIKIPGRMQVDLYNHFRREENFISYKLDYVSGIYIGDYIKGVTDLMDGTSQIITSNVSGLVPGSYIHIEEIGYSTEYYNNGCKYCIVSVNHETKTFIVSGSGISPNTTKKIRWCLAKDDITPQDIFRLTRGSSYDRSIIAKYCIADCTLVHALMNKADILTGFVEMSAICSVPINFLVMRGQGIKLTSYVSKKCRTKGVLMPVMDKGNIFDAYEGAVVLPPKCAMYLDTPVACVDYASLYPSSIISENLSHDTKVWTKTFNLEGVLVEECGEKGSDGNYLYDNIEGYKYVDIPYDVYKYVRKSTKSKSAKFDKVLVGRKICRFVQPNTIIGDGIMPSILEELLHARKSTRALIKKEKDEFMKNVLDKRQLGYKVTANSLYGQCGAKTSTFYDQDIAASTTATGRLLLTYAQRVIEDCYGGGVVVHTTMHGNVKTYAEYIYGDTDSVFFTFNLRDMTDKPIIGPLALQITIELAQQAGNLASSFLKKPHDLEYEKTFMPFCLLSKKRYVGILYELDHTVGKRKEMGIVLKRRDNASIVKDVYGGIIDILMKNANIEESIRFLRMHLQNLTDEVTPIEKLVITKALRGYYVNPKGIAHKVLADRIGVREPGNKPGSGDRISYMYIVTPNKKGMTQGDKIETPEYIKTARLKIDYSFYISNQIMKPVSQLFALVLADVYRICNPRVKTNINNITTEKDRISMIENLLFNPFLVKTNNSKQNLQSITSFFKPLNV